jgi:hypothetical protein
MQVPHSKCLPEHQVPAKGGGFVRYKLILAFPQMQCSSHRSFVPGTKCPFSFDQFKLFQEEKR